jgi:hypothetical protein
VDLSGLHTEARLAGGYAGLRDRATLRLLAARAARGREVDEDAVRDAALAFRRGRHLLSTAEAEAWLADNDLTAGGFAALMRTEALLADLRRDLQDELPAYLRAQLRLDGRYPAVAARLKDKRAFLSAHGVDAGATGTDAVGAGELLRWHRDRRPTPSGNAAVAPASDVPDLDFPDPVSLRDALLEEYRFVTGRTSGGPPGDDGPAATVTSRDG